MRLIVYNRTSVISENKGRLSYANYGNRKCYDIQTSILEKTLLYEITFFTQQSTVHFIDDRQTCYYRQIPEIDFLTECSFGIYESEAEMFTKILKKFRYHLFSAYGISDEIYGGHYNQLGGTGQGNVLSVAICLNVTCLIFKILKEKNWYRRQVSRILS